MINLLSITANQIAAHMVGDYLLQSDWMASEKTKQSLAAFCHVVMYTLPFMLLTLDWRALLIIAASHFVIDRWRLARYVVYAKNFLSPPEHWHSWEECSGTGYHESRPAFLAVWLMIIADNVMHIVINGWALSL